MAQGDNNVTLELGGSMGDEGQDFLADTLTARLCSTTVATAAGSSDWTDYTECASGGSYTQGGETLAGKTYNRTGNDVFLVSSTNPSWPQAASSPTDIATLVVHNAQAPAGEEVLCVVDMTTDGSTPVSMVAGEISCTWNGSGIFKVSRVVV